MTLAPARGSSSPRPPQRSRFPAPDRTWLLVFVVALGVRLAYAWLAAGLGAIPSSDTASYDTVAWNLARGAGFALGTGADTYPTAFVPPIVPWLTSFVYRAAGHSYFAALVLQCVLGALVPVLLYGLAGLLFGSPVARLSAWLAVFDPLLVFFSGYLLTETAFAATLLLALLATVHWVRTPRRGRSLGAGMLWGLAALTRPTALPLPLLMAAWAWVPIGLTVQPRERLRQIAFLLLGTALVVAPWTLRNAAVLKAFVPVTTGAGRALLDSNNDRVWNDPALRGNALTVYAIEPYASELRGHSEPETDRRARAMALTFLRAHAAQWPAVAAAKVGRMWRLGAEGGTTGSWQREGSPLTGVLRRVDPLLLWSIPVFLLALAGLVDTLRGPRRWFQAVGVIPLGYTTLLACVFWGALRVRVPVQPMVLLYAAAGAEAARRMWRVRRSGFTVVEGRGTRASAGM
jgi:4-amino-4-deoxy-L-arabinose transferase-like glycosyltransferase